MRKHKKKPQGNAALVLAVVFAILEIVDKLLEIVKELIDWSRS